MSEFVNSNGKTGVPAPRPVAAANENLTDYLFDSQSFQASLGGCARTHFDRRQLFHAEIARRILSQLSIRGHPNMNAQVGS